jgi:hypothetical protein
MVEIKPGYRLFSAVKLEIGHWKVAKVPV